MEHGRGQHSTERGSQIPTSGGEENTGRKEIMASHSLILFPVVALTLVARELTDLEVITCAVVASKGFRLFR